MKQFSSRKNESKYYTNLYIEEVIKKYNSKFQIRYKRESKLFKWLKPILLLINKNFFTDYVTVLGGTMWVPDNFYDSNYKSVLKIVAHEGVHEYDRQRLPKFVFELLYAIPQIFFIPFMIMAIFLSWWFLIPALIMLAPLPAPGRYWIEMRGYAVEKIWKEQIHTNNFSNPESFVIYNLSNINTYYATWPFKKSIKKRFQKPIDYDNKAFKDIVDFLDKYDLIEK